MFKVFQFYFVFIPIGSNAVKVHNHPVVELESAMTFYIHDIHTSPLIIYQYGIHTRNIDILQLHVGHLMPYERNGIVGTFITRRTFCQCQQNDRDG